MFSIKFSTSKKQIFSRLFYFITVSVLILYSIIYFCYIEPYLISFFNYSSLAILILFLSCLILFCTSVTINQVNCSQEKSVDLWLTPLNCEGLPVKKDPFFQDAFPGYIFESSPQRDSPWELSRSKLRLISVLGEGNFGIVSSKTIFVTLLFYMTLFRKRLQTHQLDIFF